MDFMNQNLDYRLVLADLRARRVKLDAAISAIEAILGETRPPVNETLFPETRPDSQNTAPNGAYSQLTIAAAAAHYLESAGKPQTMISLVEGLRRGGIPSKSKNLYRTLYNTLNSKLDTEFTRDGKKWGLAKWRQP